MTLRHIAALVFGLSLLVAGVTTLGPAALGGSARILVSAGSSMEPGINVGDLVLVRSRSSYDVGDVVAYKSPDLGTVLHRIVDVRETSTGDEFVLQGDNNDFLDSETPGADLIIGEKTMLVPRGGKLLGLLPVAVAGLATLYFFMRSDGSSGAGHGVAPARMHPRRAIGLAVLIVFGVTSVIATLAPSTTGTVREVSSSTGVTMGWSAEPEESVVYPDGMLREGDPLFLREIDEVEVTAAVEPDAAINVRGGTISLSAELGDNTGWRHRIELDGPVAAVGDDLTLSGNLDLVALNRVLEELASRTGLTPSNHQLTLIVDGSINGSIDGEQIEVAVEHQVPFTIDDLVVAAGDGAPWSGTARSSVAVDETMASSIGLGPLTLSVMQLRVIAPIGLLVGLALFLASQSPVEAHETLNRRVSGSLVQLSGGMPAEYAPAVAVDAFDDLLRMAELEGSPVLYAKEGGHQWATFAMGVWYHFWLAQQPKVAETMRVRLRPRTIDRPDTES